MAKKQPPVEKIFEAWTALASGRMELGVDATQESGEARVRSSNGDKTYHITWQGNVFTSDDNASYWQGYAGYPVIAVLMKLGLAPFDESLASLFANVDWHAANKEAKGDYAKAVAAVENELGLDQSARDAAALAARTCLDAIIALNIIIKRPPRKRSDAAGR